MDTEQHCVDLCANNNGGPGRGRGQVPFANLGGGARANAELPVNENPGGQSCPPPVGFADIMTVFRRAVREVTAGQAALRAGESRAGTDTGYFNRTIVILLHLVCLLTKLIPHLEPDKASLQFYGQSHYKLLLLFYHVHKPLLDYIVSKLK